MKKKHRFEHGNVCHDVWVNKDREMFMANDEDDFYVEEFVTAEEVDEFIKKLQKAKKKAFHGRTK